MKRDSVHKLLHQRERVLFYVRYWVLTVVLYSLPQKVGLNVLCVREVEAASCRVFLVELDVVLLPLVVVID